MTTMNKTELQLHSIQNYMDAVSDFHEATLLVAEMRTRLVEAVEANREAGMTNPDPLSAVIGAVVVETSVEKVARKIVEPKVSTNGRRTRNSPRNSPGTTKQAVYDALPGDASAIAKRTGLSVTQVYGAMADLVNAGFAERHGTRGNTTYTVKGECKKWTAKEWASIHYHTIKAN